jgi:hypothetical protein
VVPKRLVYLLGFLFLLPGSRIECQNVYRWIGENGKIHLVDEIGQVPPAYREDLKVYRVSSGRKKGSPAKEPEDARPLTSQVSQGGETAGTSSASSTDTTSTLEVLQQREKNLAQEKARLKVLETRFRTKTSRSRIYTKRIEELDKEIEAIEKEIDERLRSGP